MDKFFNAEEARKRSESKLDEVATSPWMGLVFEKINEAIKSGNRSVNCPFAVWLDNRSMPSNIENRVRQKLISMGYTITRHNVEPSCDPRDQSYDTLEW